MMTTDRELLERAAKAAGENFEYRGFGIGPLQLSRIVSSNNENGITAYKPWNPLIDNGDALRLAVKLRISVMQPAPEDRGNILALGAIGSAVSEPRSTDPYAATRLAIVRAAAEIGKEIKK